MTDFAVIVGAWAVHIWIALAGAAAIFAMALSPWNPSRQIKNVALGIVCLLTVVESIILCIGTWRYPKLLFLSVGGVIVGAIIVFTSIRVGWRIGGIFAKHSRGRRTAKRLSITLGAAILLGALTAIFVPPFIMAVPLGLAVAFGISLICNPLLSRAAMIGRAGLILGLFAITLVSQFMGPSLLIISLLVGLAVVGTALVDTYRSTSSATKFAA